MNILFPFYKKQHHILKSNLIFRTVIVLFIVFSICLPFLIMKESRKNLDRCWDTILTPDHKNQYGLSMSEEMKICSKYEEELKDDIVLDTIIGSIIVYYLIQFIFFKIIINFIILNNKNNE